MLQTPSKTTQTLLSPRIPRDNEHERYHPELRNLRLSQAVSVSEHHLLHPEA